MTEKIIHFNNVHICTESFGDINNPTILLIMGATASMIYWEEDFCKRLSNKGFHVIRYDNRDTGKSITYAYGHPEYTFEDLADDAIEVLDAYKVDKAHIVGMSMGGIITQIIALKHPDRVLTISLIMTSNFDSNLPKKDSKVTEALGELKIKNWQDKDEVIECFIKKSKVLVGSKNIFDEEKIRRLNEEEFNLNDKDAVKDMKDFMGIDVDDSVEVIDPNAETEDDLEDSYVGKVILDCVVCHSKQYKDPNEVVIDDGELANVGEECPFCYTSDGFKVVGQVAPFDESDEDDDDQDEDDDYDEDEDDDSEFESWRNRIQECLKRLNEAGMSDEDEADTAILANIYTKTQQRANAALTPDEKAVLAKYGLSRDSGMKNIVDKDWNRLVQRRRGQDSDKVNLADRARKMGPRAKNNKDLYLAFRSSDTTDSHDARGRYR